MTKEVKMYEAKDGTLFKTKKSAENYDKKLAVESVLVDLGLTKEEVSQKLMELSKINFVIKSLLNNEGDWAKWSTHHILMINQDLFKPPLKKTLYVKKYKDWGKVKEEILYEEIGDDFTDPELHCEDEYKVVDVICENPILKKVYLDYKYTWDERIARKLNSGVELSESEINGLIYNFEEVYREEGEDRRWSRSVLSVIKIGDKLYAIEWEHGLTENQDDAFWEQPYEVELNTREVVIKKTITEIVKK